MRRTQPGNKNGPYSLRSKGRSLCVGNEREEGFRPKPGGDRLRSYKAVVLRLVARGLAFMFVALFAQQRLAGEADLVALDGEHFDQHLVAQL